VTVALELVALDLGALVGENPLLLLIEGEVRDKGSSAPGCPLLRSAGKALAAP
jgi:hypothetical protein